MDIEIVNFTDNRQTTNYSCGAVALKSVLEKFGHSFTEKELILKLESTSDGTYPQKIVSFCTYLGFDSFIIENLTFSDLSFFLNRRIPVILMLQSWRDREDLSVPWKDVWNSGHYVVLEGMNKNSVFIEDPSLKDSKGVIPKEEFLNRWHDYYILDGKCIRLYCSAIIIKNK